MSDAPPPRGIKALPVEQRLALYNAAIVTVGAVLAAIAWFPNFQGKQQELSAFELLKDNPAGVLTVRDLGPAGAGTHRYDVSYTLLLKNTGSRDFDIAWSLDQLFVGNSAKDAGAAAPAVVNDPADIWDPSPPGMLRWNERGYDLALEDDLNDRDVTQFFDERKKRVTSPGGGLTGRYAPGHVSAHSARYILVASPDSFVNVTITYGMNRAPTLWQRITGNTPSSLYDDANLAGETVRFADAAQPGCRLGIAVQNSQITSACTANPF